jgi:CheY-like chemotaxis protein
MGLESHAPTIPSTEMPRPVVLVANKEPHVVHLLQANLECAGYAVLTAGDGLEALERLEERSPDLIVLDTLMPRMCGWDLIKVLRSRPDTLLTPIFMLSAAPPTQPRVAICRELADAYIQLPFNPRDMLSLIDLRLAHLSEDSRADLLAWRQARFGKELTPDVAAGYLASAHYVAVRKEAQAALGEMGATAIPALAQVAAGDDEAGWRDALSLLGQRTEEDATRALTTLLTHPDRERRWEALVAIGAISADGALQAVSTAGQAVLEELAAALDEPDADLQKSAIRALQRVRLPDAFRIVQAFSVRASGPIQEEAQSALRWMNRA